MTKRSRLSVVSNRAFIPYSDGRGQILTPELTPVRNRNFRRGWGTGVVLTHSLHVAVNGANRTGFSATDDTEWDGIQKFCGSCWIRNNGSGTQWFFGKPTSASPWRVGFVASTGGMAFGTAAGTLSLTDALLTASVWHNVSWSYDGTQATTNNRFRAWVDGTEYTTKSGSCSTSLAANASLLGVGGNSSGTTGPDYDICHLGVWIGSLIDGTIATEIRNGGVPLDLRYTSKGQPLHYYQLQNDFSDTGSNPITGTGLNSPSFTTAVPP